MSKPCLTCVYNTTESNPDRTPCPYCGEGYMYYKPCILSDKDEEIKTLQSEKDDLENQVYKLEQELEKMREYYNA